MFPILLFMLSFSALYTGLKYCDECSYYTNWSLFVLAVSVVGFVSILSRLVIIAMMQCVQYKICCIFELITLLSISLVPPMMLYEMTFLSEDEKYYLCEKFLFYAYSLQNSTVVITILALFLHLDVFYDIYVTWSPSACAGQRAT
ncbi:hypothetical protein NPIL_32631 [Nephila pilipes]|uniref:Uncharacterized protein n=1 Tax=Nephila pilipes TaxID=299642 RepID=A0A8X6R428_NEPPI|nr:hypothetical protein NPIL_32631 [Nephila pilipes]